MIMYVILTQYQYFIFKHHKHCQYQYFTTCLLATTGFEQSSFWSIMLLNDNNSVAQFITTPLHTSHFTQWCTDNLQLNVEKTKEHTADSFKCLELILDNKLSFDLEHV